MVPFLFLAVADVMTTDPLTIESNTPLAKLRNLFEAFEYNALPVVEDGEFLGWVTQFDLLSAFKMSQQSIMPRYDEILAEPASLVMNPEPDWVAPEEPLNQILTRIVETRHRSFPVLVKGKLVGVVAIEDILKGLYKEMDER